MLDGPNRGELELTVKRFAAFRELQCGKPLLRLVGEFKRETSHYELKLLLPCWRGRMKMLNKCWTNGRLSGGKPVKCGRVPIANRLANLYSRCSCYA